MAKHDEVEGRDEVIARMIGEQAGTAVLNSRRIVRRRQWAALIEEVRARFQDPSSPISGAQVRLFLEGLLKRDGAALLSPRGLFILLVDSKFGRRGDRAGDGGAGS